MKSKRQHEIIRLLIHKHILRTEELASYFSVSMETIRRDINDLERNGLVKKVYGGIQIVSDGMRISTAQGNWNARLKYCHAEKAQIATHTLELIPDECTIALDIGTTTYELARLLGSKKNLSIITNSLHIALELIQNAKHRVYLIGGLISQDEMVTTGVFARGFISNFSNIDFYISGCDGLSIEKGITEASEYDIDVKRCFINIANRIITVADYTKFGKNENFTAFSLEKINTIVTDSKAPENMLHQIRQLGVNIIVAPETKPI